MQLNVEDVGALALSEMNEEQAQASVEVGKTSIADVIMIEVDLHKTIEMIVEKKNVILYLVQTQNNKNEHVIKHVDMNACDILNLFYNLLPYPSFILERMVGLFFWQICNCVMTLALGL
jgi:hypothetical protein